jgi:hypothetical protein
MYISSNFIKKDQEELIFPNSTSISISSNSLRTNSNDIISFQSKALSFSSSGIITKTNNILFPNKNIGHQDSFFNFSGYAIGILPEPPQNVKINRTNNSGELSISFSSSYNGGSTIINYTIFNDEYKFTTSESQIIIKDLIDGIPYQFKIYSTNLSGDSDTILVDAISPGIKPNKPTIKSIQTSDKSVDLTWVPPYNGGFDILKYKLYINNDDPIEINTFNYDSDGNIVYKANNLINGNTYNFKISAENTLGEGELLEIENIIPFTKPYIISNTQINNSVSVTWYYTDSYEYYNLYVYNSDDTLKESISNISSNSHIISNLTNGNTYKFKVSVVNNTKEIFSDVTSLSLFLSPSSPSITSFNASSTSVDLYWSNSESDDGSPLTAYKVYVYNSSDTLLSNITLSKDTLNTTITNLSSNTLYKFKVASVNIAGETLSSSVSVTTTSVPNNSPSIMAPSSPFITSSTPSVTSVDLSWSVPLSDGGSPLTAYKVYVYNSSDTLLSNITLSKDTLNTTVSSLTGNTLYKFKVAAINVSGETLSSSVSVTTKSSAPTITSSSPSSSTVQLYWSSPSSNGVLPLTSYKVYVYNSSDTQLSSITLSNSTLNTTVSSLASGTLYKFKVAAVNVSGETLSSSVSVTTTSSITAPSSPSITSSTSFVTNVDLSWSAPLSNGGSPITSYKVYVYNSSDILLSTISASTNLSLTISNLLANTLYKFKVSAVNIAGETLSSFISKTTNVIPLTNIINGLSITNVTLPNSLFYYLNSSSSSPLLITKESGKEWNINVKFLNNFPTTYTLVMRIEGLGINNDKSLFMVRISSGTNIIYNFYRDALPLSITTSPSYYSLTTTRNIQKDFRIKLKDNINQTDQILSIDNYSNNIYSGVFSNPLSTLVGIGYTHYSGKNIKISIAINSTSTGSNTKYNSINYR